MENQDWKAQVDWDKVFSGEARVQDFFSKDTYYTKAATIIGYRANQVYIVLHSSNIKGVVEELANVERHYDNPRGPLNSPAFKVIDSPMYESSSFTDEDLKVVQQRTIFYLNHIAETKGIKYKLEGDGWSDEDGRWTLTLDRDCYSRKINKKLNNKAMDNAASIAVHSALIEFFKTK